MSYAKIYERCQSLPTPVDANAVADFAAKLVNLPERPRLFRSGTMKSGALRGKFIHPGNTEHPLAKHCKGNPIVVIARDLNPCWSRFVYLKEVMHLFDQSLATVGTREEFEKLLNGMTAPAPGHIPPSVDAEYSAYWIALGCFCPEQLRQDLQRRRQSGELTDLEIARLLRIPELTISNLFRPDYKDLMSILTAE